MMVVVTSFFNPENYATKRDNFYSFVGALDRFKIPWFCIQALYGTETPVNVEQYDSPGTIINVKGKDILWQKERMLNEAVKRLSKRFDKIVWCDCDIIFENKKWFQETESLLDRYAVVQPFETAVRLPEGHKRYWWRGMKYKSFAKRLHEDPDALLKNNFENHGHTGFVWAARRSIIEKHGLYEMCIAGGGDHMMAHVFAGDWESPCVHRYIHGSKNYIKHFQTWAKAIYKDVRASVGYTSGRILHLWHGDMGNRRYAIRNNELCSLKFDPDKDVTIGKSRLLQWTKKGKRIDKWAREYFKARKEDGALPLRTTWV